MNAHILTFLRLGTSFDPSQVRALGEAYEKAIEALGRQGQAVAEEVVASEIIALAGLGNCDPDFLSATVVTRLSAAR